MILSRPSWIPSVSGTCNANTAFRTKHSYSTTSIYLLTVSIESYILELERREKDVEYYSIYETVYHSNASKQANKQPLWWCEARFFFVLRWHVLSLLCVHSNVDSFFLFYLYLSLSTFARVWCLVPRLY